MFQSLLALVAAFFLTASGVAIADDASEPKHLKKFVRFTDCEFLETAYADGDSFKVRVDGHERVLRLYFVDTPESDTRFPVRNAEQAEYFGITPEQSVAMGKVAKQFVRDALWGKTLTTLTHQIRLEEPVNTAKKIYWLAQFLLSRHWLVKSPLRLIGIGVSTLASPGGDQLLLPI